MERHCKQIQLACVGSACSLWTILGLIEPTVVCAFWFHISQVPGCSARALCQVGPVFHALLRSKWLRFSGTLQGHGPRWDVPSQVWTAQTTGRLVSAQSPMCLCLLWGVDLRIWQYYQMSTVQDPRKANVQSLVEDAVPGAKIEAATCLSALAVSGPPFFLWHFPLRTLQFLYLHLLFLFGLTFFLTYI